MPDSSFGPLRLYDGSPPIGEAPPDPPSSLATLARALASQETLRATRGLREEPEPLSLQWYLGLEQVRHNRQGRWLPKLLEFGKHQGEKLLGLGSGLGSDLVRYAASGANVIAACRGADQLALVRRNFELRNLDGAFLHAGPRALPVDSASIDVVCMTGLLHEPDDPAAVVDEVYRVLKPGGKLLAVVPAHYDIHFWGRLFLLGHGREREAAPAPGVPADLTRQGGRRFKGREVRHLLSRFVECRVWKRHLRRAEVPHLWRWVPLLSLLERLAGRLLIFKGFKPVSSARLDQAVA